MASSLSRSGQRETVFVTCGQLGCVIGSAVADAVGLGRSWQRNTDLIAAVLFTGSLALTVVLGYGRGQQRWYAGRAAAESIKSLTWKYVSRAAPFDQPLSAQTEAQSSVPVMSQKMDSAADTLFIGRLRDIFDGLRDMNLVVDLSGSPSTSYISDQMQDIRKAPLAMRREVYIRGRIDDQLGWYRRNAARAQTAGWWWTAAALVCAAMGIGGGFWRAAGGTLDLLGPAAALLASVTAWTQLRQYQPTATAYTVTTVDLELIRSAADLATGEAEWARFVEQAENAISREHTTWLARRR